MSADDRPDVWAAILLILMLLLASSLGSARAAELRIGNAQGYPGDTVDIKLSLQGDGATVSASFFIERSWVADFTSAPATLLSPGATCAREGSGLRVSWIGGANTDLVDLCVVRMKIYNGDPRFNPAIFGAPRFCFDAANLPQPCSVVRGSIDVIYETERSFIAVLHDPPRAPSLKDVVDFDYSDVDATPLLAFTRSVRPQYALRTTHSSSTAYRQWLGDNPQSPISRLEERGARFTFGTLEQRDQALQAARSDPAVREIVESLGLAGPALTYPVQPRENQPFALYLVGPGCPLIYIATPDSRSIETVGQQVQITLDPLYPDQLCFAVAYPGYSTAVVQIPGLAAGTYDIRVDTPAGEYSLEVVVAQGSVFVPAPTQIPNPDVPMWLILGVLMLAFGGFSTRAR